MAYDQRPDQKPVYDAAARWVDEHWRADGSLFRPGSSVASAARLTDLDERFRGKADLSSDSFLTKFERQLQGAPDEIVQLAGELLYAHLIFADDIGGTSKRKTLRTVLGWADDVVEIPSDLDLALDHGLANTGIAFKTFRPHQLWFLIDALVTWKGLPNADRRDLLDDPWRFKDFLFHVPITSAYTQREAVLHLLHPEHFEDICSRSHKQRIVETFEDRLDGARGDVDRDLLAIRSSLSAERPDFASFYEPGVVELWQGERVEEDASPASGQARAWLVRHKVHGQARLERWLSDGYASIGWRELGPEAITATREELMGLTQRAYADHSPGRQRVTVGNVHRFLHQARAGDLVVSPDGDAIYIGVFTSAAEYVPDVDEAYRRGVEWANAQEPVSRQDLSESAYSKLRALLTVSDVSGDAAEFAELAGLDVSVAEEAAAPLPPKRKGVAQLPDADDGLARSLLLPEPWLQEVIDLLRSKRQLIFYGPPGTGKTYVAQRLADHLTQHGGTYTLVQFHPSYAYEDFFEGFRPRPSETAGGVSFELVPGPLRRIAEQAADDPENPYILLIDEINRANLAKVFGELYFLLEYRERSMALQYSPEDEFTLPKNLFVVGTMNTADRSIARIDAAMRRRFLFVPFFPDRHPIDQLLARWLAREGHGREADEILAELNRRIDDPDATVGPSYLMTADVERTGGLERIWHHAIMPLLEEHFLGSGIDIAERFGLAALRRAVDPGTSPTDPDGPNEASGAP